MRKLDEQEPGTQDADKWLALLEDDLFSVDEIQEIAADMNNRWGNPLEYDHADVIVQTIALMIQRLEEKRLGVAK